MSILDWINMKYPGTQKHDDYVLRIDHTRGETSFLWTRESGAIVPDELLGVLDVYSAYDGVDLISSTFKIAAVNTPRYIEGIEVVPSIDEMKKIVMDEGCCFPGECVPFMLQAGTWIYGISNDTNVIYEWDFELQEITGKYPNVFCVFDEWLDAISDI